MRKGNVRNGGFNPSEQILVSWDYYSQYMEIHKIHVPNHQPVTVVGTYWVCNNTWQQKRSMRNPAPIGFQPSFGGAGFRNHPQYHWENSRGGCWDAFHVEIYIYIKWYNGNGQVAGIWITFTNSCGKSWFVRTDNGCVINSYNMRLMV